MSSAALHDLALRPADTSDGALVMWLEEVCMKDYATALWGSWRASSSLTDLDLSTHQIIERDGQPVGCLASRVREGALHLTRLYLDPAYRNQGIGAQVLRGVLDLAATQGLPVRLSVLTTNPAHLFYLREGFTLERETPERRHLVCAPQSQGPCP